MAHPNYKIRYFLVAVLLAAFAFLAIYLSFFGALASLEDEPPAPQPDISAGPSVRIGDAAIFVEVATSSAATQKGLSGRDSLAYNHGMLFIFLQPGLYRFWMPDMHFPIDIIWIAGERVVGITGDISPEFDPDHPVFYTPPVPAQYALEVNAGFAAANNIKAGDKTIFNGIK